MSFDCSFDTYEEEFQPLTSQIQRQLGQLGMHDEKENDILQLFSQCDSILLNMSIEARNNEEEKEELLSRLKLYKIQLQSFKKHYRETKGETKTDLQREQRFAPNHPSSAVNKASNSRTTKEDLLTTRLQVNQQNATLERARQSMADTEETAAAISEELHRNRETIERSQNKVADFSGLTNDANRILSRMKKRWF